MDEGLVPGDLVGAPRTPAVGLIISVDITTAIVMWLNPIERSSEAFIQTCLVTRLLRLQGSDACLLPG